MSAFECPREQEVLDEIRRRRLAGPRVGRAARPCRRVRRLPRPGRGGVAAARGRRTRRCRRRCVPSPGQVWWRAELRARNEATRSVAAADDDRPGAGRRLHDCGVSRAASPVAAPSIAGWIGRFAGDASPSKRDLVAVSGFVAQWRSLLALAAGAWLVLAPVAVYLLVRDERTVGLTGLQATGSRLQGLCRAAPGLSPASPRPFRGIAVLWPDSSQQGIDGRLTTKFPTEPQGAKRPRPAARGP